MRILYLVHQFLPEFSGGTERVTLNLAHAAQAEGHHVEVLTTSHRPGAPWREEGGLRTCSVEGVPVHAVPRKDGRPLEELGFRPIQGMREAFERFLDARRRFDVVHVMHSMRLNDAVQLLRDRRLGYVVTLTDFHFICHRINLIRLDGSLCEGPAGGRNCQLHCWSPEIGEREFAGRVERLGGLLAGASAVVAVSDYVAERFRAEHPDLPIRVVGNGVDLLSFPRPRPRSLEGRLTFGYLGTVSEAKGAGLLARAFVQAGRADARLRIVGPCYEPELAARIASEAGAAEISVEPPVPAGDVPGLLQEFDVLCVPSQVPESFSLALHEGFAAGLPALVSNLGNAGRVVREHGCGLALPASDASAWAEAIGKACEDRTQLADWRDKAPLPLRVEEEGFIYTQLYRAVAASRRAAA
jgi:glycosyltransferase involved in cell wall biosynthesis